MPRRFASLALASFFFFAATASAEPAKTPDLVVVISVDQMRADYLTRFAPWFSKGGFARLVREGANFTEAAHRHATTLTAPGHASIGSGLDPRDHGILGNTWFDRIADDRDACVDDPHVDLSVTSRDGASPWKLSYRGLGDAVKERYRGSKVIAVSMKDRAAILMGGRKADAAYWFDTGPGAFVSSSYYAWNPAVLKFNEHLSDYVKAHDTWTLSGIIPPDDLARITFDPEELRQYKRAAFGMGPSFPHAIGNLDALETSPFFNTLVIDLGMHVVGVEKLGTADGTPDILFLGPSSIDYIGHDFGPDSMEIADGMVRLDRDIERLLEFLDANFKGRFTVVLTADHGVQQIPEVALAQGKKAGRFSFPNPGHLASTIGDLDPARLDLEKAIAKELGLEVSDEDPVGKAFIRWVTTPGFWLNWRMVAEHGIDPEEARQAVRRCVLRLDGVHAAWTSSELLAATPAKTDLEAEVRRSFRADRSPDVVVALEPGFIFSSWTRGTTHGQAVEEDSRVPLLSWGVGVTKGTWDVPAAPVDMIHTLGMILGVDAGGADTKVLPCIEH